MESINIVHALICILGALVALLIALVQIRYELRQIWKEGIRETHEMEVSEDFIHRVTLLVLSDIDNRLNWPRDILSSLIRDWDNLDDTTRKDMAERVNELIK